VRRLSVTFAQISQNILSVFTPLAERSAILDGTPKIFWDNSQNPTNFSLTPTCVAATMGIKELWAESLGEIKKALIISSTYSKGPLLVGVSLWAAQKMPF